MDTKHSAIATDERASLLIDTIQKLSTARSLDDVTRTVRTAARRMVNADGASFVLQERKHCYYADEEAIAPLWKGKRFPLESCISGWAMLNKQQAIIEDIYADPRIPHDAYKPTFVKSLVMTPVRRQDPIAAIGTYWAVHRTATTEEATLLQTLADTTAVALANVQLYNELDQRVKERTSQLEAANRELEAFASRVSHDLVSPLRGVSMAAEALLASAQTDPEQLRSCLEAIGSEAKRMIDLTDSLLKLSRLSFTELDWQPIDAGRLSQDILDRLSADSAQRKKQLRVAGNLELFGDRVLLSSLLENLLSNAWKFTSKCSETLIEVGIAEEDDRTITFFVQDNGTGFDPEREEEVFQAFKRLHSTREFPGTGVGLATAKRIVIKHRGSIWSKSQPGKGATFYCRLPKSQT
jgi:signal transduction histidine kinase